MDAYRIHISQTCDRIDASFDEYVETLEQAAYTVKRFHTIDPAEKSYRHVISITIEYIHIQKRYEPRAEPDPRD